MNLNNLNQKINNYTVVVSSWLKQISTLYFDNEAKDVEVSLLDEDENIVKTTLPNFAKLKQGDENQRFKVAPAVENNEAINKAQFEDFAGKLLQIKTFQSQPTNDDYTLIGEYVVYDTQVKLKITPKSANSKLIILAEHQVRYISAPGISAGLKRDGNYVTPSFKSNTLFFSYKGDNVNHHTQALVHTTVPSNNTNETEFVLFVSPWAGTAEVNNGWGNRYMMIMEVAE